MNWLDRFISWLYTHRIFGSRCWIYDEECHCCKAWDFHDEMFAVIV